MLNSSSQIISTISRLRQLTRKNVMTQWRVCQTPLAPRDALDPSQWPSWSMANLNARHHIAWDKGQRPIWIAQRLTLPQTLQGYPLAGLYLRLDLTWWAEKAEIYVQGKLVQEGDLYDCFGRVLLTQRVIPETVIDVAIHLISPGHDAGALVKSCLWFEPQDVQQPDPGMIGDELAILQGYLQAFRPQDLSSLADKVKVLNWSARSHPEQFHRTLSEFRHSLQGWSDWIQQRTIQWIGHAHLDMAWLWPLSETWDVAERTFRSALTLLDDYPELRFCHSSPALYDWIERHHPDQFAQILAKVREDQWEIAAGLWVEPEFNLVSGESIVRQVLYGQLYTQEKFGVLSATAWLPDSFGFCWQLPQILKQGGIQYFVTQKLRWNDTTEFPHEVFQWRSPDGTEILSIMLPPIGTRIDPVKMATFAQQWEKSTGAKTSFWLPGVGDHGGGPTRDMVETARRWQTSSLTPKLEPASAEQFCQTMAQSLTDIPVWDNELYLEFHRGCYTSHADQKRYNRQCEATLFEAELFSALATLATHAAYPKQELESAWKKVLFNQFHDILPGSSIPQVFVDANQDWEAALKTGTDLRQAAWDAIAHQIQVPENFNPHKTGYPLLVFNSLNWDRHDVIRTRVPQALPPHHTWQVLDAKGHPLESQLSGLRDPELLFSAKIPAIGYRLFWVEPIPQKAPTPSTSNRWVLENKSLRVTLDANTGEISQIYDKVNDRNVLSGPGNQLQFFQDQGQYWDAWNIDPDYEQHRLPHARLERIKWVSSGPLEQRICVQSKFGNSTFIQDYILEGQSPILKIETQVQWQTDHVLVKAAFPLTISTEQATYDIPCGVITRPTLPNPHPLEPWQTAKWEVPALFWADMTTEETKDHQPYGVSLLNNCKYGYDARPNQLRLTLLRGSTWPDPGCDRDEHQFSYGIFPHQGHWHTAQVNQKGNEFNRPLQCYWLSKPFSSSGTLPPSHSFININEALTLMAFKQAEDHESAWILRCHESQGETTSLNFSSALNLGVKYPVDGLERPQKESIPTSLQPWQILSVSLSLQSFASAADDS